MKRIPPLKERLDVLLARERSLLEAFGLPRCWQDVEHEDWPADPVAGWYSLLSDEAVKAAEEAGHTLEWNEAGGVPHVMVFPDVEFEIITGAFHHTGYNRISRPFGRVDESQMSVRPDPPQSAVDACRRLYDAEPGRSHRKTGRGSIVGDRKLD